MEFFTRVLSGNSRLKERAREAAQLNQTFKANLDNFKRLLESEESEDVLALLDMVYDSSFPEEQIFMKIPSRARLKSKREVVIRLLIGLDSLGVPVMAEMLAFIRKHGPAEVADSLMTLLEFLSPLLEGKETPDFSTDDVMDAMDFEWHSTSRVGSPLLNVIASATSSPARASTASIGDSPLHPSISASPYRRAISDRSMLASRAHELGAKLVLDKASTVSMPPRPSLTMSASLPYPSANQDFRLDQPTIIEAAASPEIIQESTNEKPSSYSLNDTLPASSQHGLQRKHRRKSSSLQQLFMEDAIDELSREGSVGASSKRNSSSSSWRRNSSELTKIIMNTSETSSPMNPGLDAGDSREGASVALDKEFLSSIHTQDRHVNRSSRKGSRRISPSPPPDEVALWREDSGGFSVDVVPSIKSAAPTLDNLNPTERHADGVEASSICEDLIKSSKSNIFEQEKDILPAYDSSSLSKNDFGESLNIVSQSAQSTNSDVVPGNELSKAEEDTEKLISDKEEPSESIDVGKSTEKPLETEKVSYMKQNQIEESGQDANGHQGDGKLEAIDSATNEDQRKFSEDESIKSEDVNVDSISGKEPEMKVEHIDGYGAEVEGVNAHSVESDNDNDMNVGHEFIKMEDANACSSFHGSGVRSHEHTYSSSDSDASSSQIPIASKSSTAAQEQKADYNGLPEDQLNKNAFKAALDKLLQTKQSNNIVLQHGHQRSHSDLTPVNLTPVRSLFKAESLKQEKFNPQHGNESDSHVQRTEKLRRKFARRLRSLTASMESLRSRGGSADRLEAMPWMRMKMENNQQRQEAREGRSFSDASSDESGSAVDDAGRDKAPHEDGRPLVLQYSEASVHAVDGDDALKPLEHELGLQSYSNGDVQEDARQAQAHKEVAGRALSSSDNSYQDAGHVDTHEELHGDPNIHSSQEDAGRGCAPSSIDDYYQDAGHAHSSDTLEEDAGHAVTLVPHSSDEDNDHLSSHDSDEDEGRGLTREEVAVHAHTHEEDARHTCSSGTCDQDAGHTYMADHEQDGCKTASDKITPKKQGYGFQWILAPLLLPSSSSVSQGFDEYQAGDIAPLSLEDDKREDREHHAGLSPCEEIQSTQEADDVKLSCPLQDQRQVDIHHGSHTDVPVQSCVMNITDDTHLPFTQYVPEMINDDGGHLLSVSSNDADVPPANGITVTDNNELSGDQHPLHHVKTDEHLQDLPSLDALNRRSTEWADYADSNCTLEAPAFPESSPTNGEVCLEEILQRKDDQSSMQEALEMKDDNSPGEELNEYKSSLVEGGNSSLATDSFNHISLMENFKVEMPELITEDEKKENLPPLDVHVENVSGPYAVGEEHLKVIDGQFEKLLSELDAADGGVGEKTQEEEFARGLDKEKMQLHGEQMGIVDENTLSKENSEGEFLDNTGQFILGGPRHIPALVEFNDCNHIEDHDQANPNLQVVEPSFEHKMRQDIKGVHEADSDNISACESTTFMHVNPVESHDVASRDQQYGGSKEASMLDEQDNSKLDQDKQYGLEYPTMVEEAAQEEEAINPCWEASEVVDASDSHPLNDEDRIHPQSSSQISGPAGAQSTDTESTAPFPGSGTQCGQSRQVVDANESQPLRDIQRSAVHFAEREPYVGSFMVDNAADGDMHAGLMASLEDHEYQQANNFSHVIPLSNKTDPAAADYAHHLHGHPTSSSTLSHVESQQQSDQHVLNQPATFSDPTLHRWDMDTNVPRSKRKGSFMGKWARGCLSCCTKPHTNS